QQASARGRRRDAGAAGDVGERACRVLGTEGADDGEPLGEPAHRLATGGRDPAAWHARSLFRYPKKRKGAAGALDDGPRASPVSFRITTSYSDSEKREGTVKIGRQDRRSSAISAAHAETILVRERDLAHALLGTTIFAAP